MKYKRQIFFSAFAAAVMLLSPWDARKVAATEEYEVRLPVIMYHQVLDSPKKLGKYVISPAELEEDLSYLCGEGYEAVTVKDVMDFTEGRRKLPEKPIMLTFDDGYETDCANVLPLLQKYNMRAVFSVVGAYTETYSQKDVIKRLNYAHLSWDEIGVMLDSGLCEFQNHSYDMHSLGDRRGCMPAKGESDLHYITVMKNDIKLSNDLFFKKTGRRFTCFTYPFGSTNNTLRTLIKNMGFAASLGTYEKINVLSGNKEELYDIKRYNRSHGRKVSEILKEAEK